MDSDGNIYFEALQSILPVHEMAETIAAVLEQRTGTAVPVDCGTRQFLVKEPGDTHTCTASFPSARRDVRVVVKDADGNIDFEVSLASG